MTSPHTPNKKLKRKTMAVSSISKLDKMYKSDPNFKNTKENIFPFDDVSFDSEDNSTHGDIDAIREFEEELKYPMIPDLKFAVDKAKSTFPAIIQRAGWALLVVIAIMYAALGLVGFLLFLFGIIVLATLQIIIVIRYIINEKRRV